jgi:hypothetical protein
MTEPNGAELERITARFPDHHTLAEALRDGVNNTLARLRAERGEVHTPEDVYDTVRWMGSTAEKLTDYARAFASAAATVHQYVEDELVEAVGEQDGVPVSSLTVPDVDGSNLKLTKTTTSTHKIDPDDLLPAVAYSVLADLDLTGNVALALDDRYVRVESADRATCDEAWDRGEELLAEALMEAMRRYAGLGSFTPQVTKVRAFATELARVDTKVASTVSGAVKSAKNYGGVKMTREHPKTTKG